VDQQTELNILYPRFKRKPMKSHGGRRHVISRSKTVDKAYSGVNDSLQWCECRVWQAGQQRIAVVEAREDDCIDYRVVQNKWDP